MYQGSPLIALSARSVLSLFNVTLFVLCANYKNCSTLQVFIAQHQRKIRPFLTQHAEQLLFQAFVISRLNYCNALLAGLPSCTIKPLQMIQNAAARLVFRKPKRAHVTPLFIFLHWLPVAARIKFKTLMLAFRTATGSAPSYFHSLLRIYIPSRSPRSASKRYLVVPSQRLKITFQNVFLHLFIQLLLSFLNLYFSS